MFIWELIKTILLGIVEGITEWLPISSTGHLILLNNFIALNVSEEFWEMFEVVIQLGAILAVVLLFWQRLWPFGKNKSVTKKRKTWNLWFKIIVGVLPSAIIGLVLDDWFNAHFYNYVSVAIALVVYGVLFILIERWRAGKKVQVSRCQRQTGVCLPRLLHEVSVWGLSRWRPCEHNEFGDNNSFLFTGQTSPNKNNNV